MNSQISSVSGYNNLYSSYTKGVQNSNTNEMQAFDMMRNMQMSMIDALSDSSDSQSTSSVSSKSDASDIFMSDFNAQLNKIMMQLQTKSNSNFDKDVDAVSDALASGDLAAAKAAYAILESKAKPELPSGKTQKDQDFASLKSSLEKGDIKSAQEAVTNIRQHSLQARIEDLKNSNINSMASSLQSNYTNSANGISDLSPLLSTIA